MFTKTNITARTDTMMLMTLFLTSPKCVLVNVCTTSRCSLGISGGNWHKVSSDRVSGHVEALLAPPPLLLLDLEDVGGGERGGGGAFICGKTNEFFFRIKTNRYSFVMKKNKIKTFESLIQKTKYHSL